MTTVITKMPKNNNGLQLGEEVPDFKADSTIGPLHWYEWLGNSWAILFSHPADYTPVCTTELGKVAAIYEEFTKRGFKVAALSCDDKESHLGWIKDIEASKFSEGKVVEYPIISDPKRDVAVAYGMIDPAEKNAAGIAMAARAVFVISPTKQLKLSILYPATTGRNFDEILRAIDSVKMTADYSVATPVNWKSGEKCMIIPSIKDEDAEKKFGAFERVEVPSKKGYIRMTPDPSKTTVTNGVIGDEDELQIPKGLISGTISAAAGVLAGIIIGRITKTQED